MVGRLRSVSHVVRHRQGSGFDGLGWVPLGPKRARQDPVWSCMGPYISHTQIPDNRVIRRGSSGPVGLYRVPTGFCRNPVLARRDLTAGARRIARLSRIGARLMNGPIWNPLAFPRALRAPSGPSGPPADRRRHRWTQFHRSLPGLGGPQLLLAQPRLLARPDEAC